MRILIVEDDKTSRTMLAAVLKKGGHKVVEADNGVRALRIREAPDAPRLVILDWMMPDLDGLEVCRRLRDSLREQPPYIIMLTSRGSAEDIVAGLEVGADDYLVKPYNAGELQARVSVGCRILGLQDKLEAKIAELSDALSKVKTLQGILPICSYCKKIRDDQEGWRRMEEYVGAHSDAQFSHGICPECMNKMYPDYSDRMESDL
jgi:DNA-binding response OmpR family regulator